VEAGQAIDIAIGAAHRVENPDKEMLVFIEVQRGGYLGEDDIVRLQDDFGRAPDK
jgi:mannose-6-phosphate isomerase